MEHLKNPNDEIYDIEKLSNYERVNGEALSRVLSKCVHCDLPPGPFCDACREKIKSENVWPCKYETNKCPVKLKWAELKLHEKNCEFGQLPCENPYDCRTCSHPVEMSSMKCTHCGLGSDPECDPCKEKIKEDKEWPCEYCSRKLKWAQLKQHEKLCKEILMSLPPPLLLPPPLCRNPYDCQGCHGDIG